MAEPAGEYDIFLSHASPDKPWVETLKTRLEALGLRVWLDKDEIRAGDNWVIRLSDGLAISRYLVLVLSDHTADNRPWVTQEWTAFAAKHGPLGRPLPIKIDNGELPTIGAALEDGQGVRRRPYGIYEAPSGVPGRGAGAGGSVSPCADAWRLFVRHAV